MSVQNNLTDIPELSTLQSLKDSPLMSELVSLLEGDKPFIWEVTPDQAEMLLSLANTYNRAPSNAKIKGYVAAMARGEWEYNNATFGFYKDGRIADGQHRMQAIVKSKKTIKTVIVPGLDPSCFKTIDLGKNRTARDALEMEGHQHPGAKATACTIALKWMLYKKLSSVTTPTTAQILKFESGHRTAVRECVNYCVALQEAYGPYIGVGVIAGAILIRYLAKMKMERELFDFLESIQSGEATDSNDPATMVRRIIDRHLQAKTVKQGKLNQEAMVGTLLKAYKRKAQGKKVTSEMDVLFPARKNEKFSVCI